MKTLKMTTVIYSLPTKFFPSVYPEKFNVDFFHQANVFKFDNNFVAEYIILRYYRSKLSSRSNTLSVEDYIYLNIVDQHLRT